MRMRSTLTVRHISTISVEFAAEKYSERIRMARPVKPLEQGIINRKVVPDTNKGLYNEEIANYRLDNISNGTCF